MDSLAFDPTLVDGQVSPLKMQKEALSAAKDESAHGRVLTEEELGVLTSLRGSICPGYRDELGFDPFKLRAAPPIASKVGEVPETNAGLSKFIAEHDLTGQVEKPFLQTDSHPQLINWVWFGGKLDRQEFLDKAAVWADTYHVKGYELVIWTDHTSVDDPELLAWCKLHHIRMVNIFEAFPAKDLQPILPYLLHELNATPPNYGKASDIFRYWILWKMGGVYIDFDTPHSMLERLLDEIENPTGFLCPFSFGRKVKHMDTNDLLIAKPHHPFLKYLVDQIPARYATPLRKLISLDRDLEDQSSVGREISESVARTGPKFLAECFNQFRKHTDWKEADLVNLPTRHAAHTTGSWVIRKPTYQGPASDSIIKRVITHAVLDLLDDPSTFNFTKFAPYFSTFAHPEAMQDEVVSMLMEFYPQYFSQVKHLIVPSPAMYQQIALAMKIGPQLVEERAVLEACRYGNTQMVQFFLQSNPELVATQWKERGSELGYFPLHFAVLSGCRECLEFVLFKHLELGLSVDQKNQVQSKVDKKRNHKTPLALAIHRNCEMSMTLLMENGANASKGWKLIREPTAMRLCFEMGKMLAHTLRTELILALKPGAQEFYFLQLLGEFRFLQGQRTQQTVMECTKITKGVLSQWRHFSTEMFIANRSTVTSILDTLPPMEFMDYIQFLSANMGAEAIPIVVELCENRSKALIALITQPKRGGILIHLMRDIPSAQRVERMGDLMITLFDGDLHAIEESIMRSFPRNIQGDLLACVREKAVDRVEDEDVGEEEELPLERLERPLTHDQGVAAPTQGEFGAPPALSHKVSITVRREPEDTQNHAFV